MAGMEPPAPDPVKLLEAWMEWERGDMTPGRVMSNLKTGGLRVLLEAIVADLPVAVSLDSAGGDAIGADAAEVWTPVV
jgi:hypothetical protein